MNDYLLVLIFSAIGGVLSLVGGAILLSKESTAKKLSKYATPFAAGALLSAVFLDLLGEGVVEGDAQVLMFATLIGILLFFLAERFLHWFHHHHDEDEERRRVSKSLIIVGDTVHNALDGVAIAAGFLISPATGIITAIAVAVHEIPQEIGDFGLLLNRGMSRKKVLIVNIISALAATVFALVTFWLGSEDKLPIEWMLGISAGFLLYIAMSDVIPSIHKAASSKRILDSQPLMLLLGVVVVGLAIVFTHSFIDTGHGHGNESSIHSEDEHSDEENHIDDEHADEDHAEENHDADQKVCIQIYPPPPGCE